MISGSDKCEAYKEKFYECARKLNLKFNPDILRTRVSNLNGFKEIKMDEDMFKKCPIGELGKCLNVKYEVENINEKNLYDYFDTKYKEKEEKRINEELENKNKIVQNKQKGE